MSRKTADIECSLENRGRKVIEVVPITALGRADVGVKGSLDASTTTPNRRRPGGTAGPGEPRPDDDVEDDAEDDDDDDDDDDDTADDAVAK